MTTTSMLRVEDYRILSSTNHFKLNSEIHDMLEQGYQPWGELSVVATKNTSSPIFSQAMVKYNSVWPDM